MLVTTNHHLKQNEFLEKSKIDLYIALSIIMAGFICLCPEISFANGATIEGQLDKVGALGNGKLKTIGFSLAGIGGGLVALAKGSLKFAGIIVAIGIMVALYLEWINGGMKILNG